MEIDSAVVVGKSIGGFIAFPWLIVIGFLVSRHSLGSRKSWLWMFTGAIVSMLSVAAWFAIVESEFGTTLTINDIFASLVTFLLSVFIFRFFRHYKERSRLSANNIEEEIDNAPNNQPIQHRRR